MAVMGHFRPAQPFYLSVQTRLALTADMRLRRSVPDRRVSADRKSLIMLIGVRRRNAGRSMDQVRLKLLRGR